MTPQSDLSGLLGKQIVATIEEGPAEGPRHRTRTFRGGVIAEECLQNGTVGMVLIATGKIHRWVGRWNKIEVVDA